ncbi:MAG: indolepyruvate ferredoxin oxidoreductase subunit alpha [Thermofilum sp.]
MARAAISGDSGTRKLLLGNEAIARGAVEAGISAAAAYPGTPSTEILEALAEVAEEYGVYVEWSTNEKVALEVGIGVSMMGLRALVAMKHVGLNVASDPLMSLGYTGVVGGLVVVSADDPNAHSSQNEQDNRYYGLHSYIPVFEPSGVQEAKDMTRELFQLSEEHRTAVILRTTTRLSHSRGEVMFGAVERVHREPVFHRDPERWALLPPYSLRKHREVLERIRTLEEKLGEWPFNRFVEGDGDTLIVSAGFAHAYVREALDWLKVNPPLLKLASTYPLPRALAKRALEFRKIVVVEELEPFVEDQLRAFAQREGSSAEIHGKDLFPRVGELNTALVASGLSKALGVSFDPPRGNAAGVELPPRPPTLCPGCGHRSTYYAVKLAAARARVKPVWANDIGCYTLGFFPPFRMADFTWSMGSALGIGMGIARFSKDPVVAFIGDSTFYHAGIPGLINAVYNQYPIVVVVMDNGVTAMTGHQPHPGSGYGPTGEKRPAIPVENLARACGVEFVEVVPAYEVARLRDAVERAIKHAREKNAPAVVVARQLCALEELRMKRMRGEAVVPYVIDQAKCVKCGICIDQFSCPAIVRENGSIKILTELCAGCGVCASICPAKAIGPLSG